MTSSYTASQEVESSQFVGRQAQNTSSRSGMPSQSQAPLPGTGLEAGTRAEGAGHGGGPGEIDAYCDESNQDVNDMSPAEHVSPRSPRQTSSGFAGATSPTSAQGTQPGRAPQRTGTNKVMYDPGNGKPHEEYELDARTGVARPQPHFTAQENLGLRGQQC